MLQQTAVFLVIAVLHVLQYHRLSVQIASADYVPFSRPKSPGQALPAILGQEILGKKGCFCVLATCNVGNAMEGKNAEHNILYKSQLA